MSKGWRHSVSLKGPGVSGRLERSGREQSAGRQVRTHFKEDLHAAVWILTAGLG